MGIGAPQLLLGMAGEQFLRTTLLSHVRLYHVRWCPASAALGDAGYHVEVERYEAL